jgi:hypothetical protein
MTTVTFHEPYQGYTNGTLTGAYCGYQHEIKLTNGKTIWLYEDEFDRD